ncbi:CoA transferase subunit A [Enterococcus sp. HY326]|uniref:CoA transferase subunit A n=1 Tax=Enterococcus sp. HY326 TaxID=2971265 RepID=UPI0022408A22|nr:CoA transferase subunit A [Enterococcus sp. HY326]
MKNKQISIAEVVAKIPSGATLMINGFMGCGNPHKIIEALAASGVKDLTVIANDASMPVGPQGEDFYGIAKLIHNHQVKTLIASHVGLNPEVAQQMNAGELEVILIPQGSLAEMIRAGGAGLGGIITPTGVGTIVEDQSYTIGKTEIDGKQYLIQRPLKADIALISGFQVDESGNVWYRGTTRTFGPLMALAAETVIVEADHLVSAIEPENIVTPGVLVDFVTAKKVS